MENEQISGMRLGMYASDADLFHRVWERVGVGESCVCPVEEVHPVPTAQHAAAPSDPPCERGAERPVTESVRPHSGDRLTDDFPSPQDYPCLGQRSATQAGTLQQYIREELDSWQLYRHLARRAGGPNARTLAMLASEKHRRARRLATAYFLIAGVRYWPTDRLETPRLTSWLGVLREGFGTEQRYEYRYRAAACETSDPCLATLYTELAEENAHHAALLRSVLESSL